MKRKMIQINALQKKTDLLAEVI